MKNFNMKSKKGFTLIELLVVIGILAVLAAIAIPSVAGLIDRANVSADNTNANEMTNAIERFASEYELYVQDIGSGALNPNDLDSAQGRVYNVTGATTRGDITAIEKAQSVKVADVGDEVAIYRDTKYPVNNATLHKIVENYMKTSSSTFEPKQSDCNYYYSPDCGLVVCTETDKSETADLNALVVSGKDAKGKNLGPQTQWIDITNFSQSIPNGDGTISGNLIPANATYTCINGTVLTAGQLFPETVVDGDVYIFEDYKYTFNNSLDGWNTKVIDKTKTKYSDILEYINTKPVVSLSRTFYECKNFTDASNIKISKNVKDISYMFGYCEKLTAVPNIPNSVEKMDGMLCWCPALKTFSGNPNADGDFSNFNIPYGITDLSNAFYNCDNMIVAPKIPETVKDFRSTFMTCDNLTDVSNVIISKNATYIGQTFCGSPLITGTIIIDTNKVTTYGQFVTNLDFQQNKLNFAGNSILLDEIGAAYGINYCVNCNGYCSCGKY